MAKAIYSRAPDEGLMHPVEVSSAYLLSKQIAAARKVRRPTGNRKQTTTPIPVPGAPSTASNVSISTQTPTAVTAGGTGAAGSGGQASAYDHTHAAPVGTPVAIGNANAAGASGNFADAAHVHALAGTVGGNLSGTLPNPNVAKIHETSGPTDLTIGIINDGEYLKRVGSTLVSGTPAGGGSAPFPAWTSAAYTYALGTPVVVAGSDGNLYSLLASSTNNDPTTDNGTHWELYYLRHSITLNCGAGQRFAGSITDPAGIQQAINFIANAVGASSPQTATITIQIANNGTITINSGASTTSWTSTTQLNIGSSLLYSSGTAGNSGKSCRVTAVTGPVAGVYTYTSDNGGGSTGLSSTPANGDVFTVDYGYGTNSIIVNLPIIGPNVVISGSTSTATVPLTAFPAVTDGGAGGSFVAATIYVCYSYTWTAGGVTQETIPGIIMSFTPGANHKVTFGSFTVPTGVTGVNVYISTTLNGALSTFHKQASAFTVSGGVAAALTLSSNNSGGATPPTANPVAAAYPAALSSAATLAGVGLFRISLTPGLTINNVYLYGNTSSAIGRGVQAFYCADLSLGPNLVISSYDRNIEFSTSTVNLNTTQTDNAQANSVSALAWSQINFRGGFNIALGAVGSGFGLQFQCIASTTQDYTGLTISSATQLFAYRCGTGFNSAWGSTFRITTVTTNGQQAWNDTTTYSPTSGTVGNHNSYLEVN